MYVSLKVSFQHGLFYSLLYLCEQLQVCGQLLNLLLFRVHTECRPKHHSNVTLVCATLHTKTQFLNYFPCTIHKEQTETTRSTVFYFTTEVPLEHFQLLCVFPAKHSSLHCGGFSSLWGEKKPCTLFYTGHISRKVHACWLVTFHFSLVLFCRTLHLVLMNSTEFSSCLRLHLLAW